MEQIDFKLIKNTSIELPLMRLGSTVKKDASLLGSISINPVLWEQKGTLNYLEVNISIKRDDPRIKAIDVITQFEGITSIFIKHYPKYSSEPSRIFNHFYPNWNDEEDRLLEIDQQPITEFSYPVDYLSAHGLFSHSEVIEGNVSEVLEIGMVRGNESGEFTGNAYGEKGFTDEIICVKLGSSVKVSSVEKEENSGLALNCRNPLYETSFSFKHYHPIPFSQYIMLVYVDDSTFDLPAYVGSAEYAPDNLKVGKIVSREKTGTASYSYVISSLSSYSRMEFESVTVSDIFLKYEIGRWVFLSKVIDEKDRWTISPSSFHYWADVVGFLKQLPGT